MSLSRRTVVAAQRLIALVLLSVLGGGSTFAALVQPSQQQCTMSCCKRKLDPRCCKKHAHRSHEDRGAALKAASSCAASCFALAGARLAAATFDLSTVKVSAPLFEGGRLVSHTGEGSHYSSYDRILHQRPPPTPSL